MMAAEREEAREAIAVRLPAPDDFVAWRDYARALLAAQVPPERVVWQVAGQCSPDLFAKPLPAPTAAAEPLRVSRQFLDLAGSVILHSDPQRLALLYRTIWRLRDCPALLADAADRDVVRLDNLAKAVRRDIHKMRAFVRFRQVETQGERRFVAWFEPDHHILRANARFFANRFTNMAWSILTPKGSLHWDGATLQEGPPARKEDAPAGDPTEDLWRRYYASIFNPARLKVGAMLKEMPKRYWKNMPETALIPDLIAGAQAREAGMVAIGAADFGPRPQSLDEVRKGITTCRQCAIGCNGTRAVAAEGSSDARLMIVGEQPGDMEEQTGRPFVGPAGQLLRSELEKAGIDARRAWITNAVKHFKFTAQGRRRIHQNPSAREIDLCRWWIESERELIKPTLILALGASAARSIIGRTVSVQKERGKALIQPDGSELWITVHPSYLLRLEGEAQQKEIERFASDLGAVAARIRA